MYNILGIASYFLSRVDEDAGDLISNLKLQKQLYYAQGFTLAMFDKPLFPERIEAWTHGPVVPDVYHYFKKSGDGPIPSPDYAPQLEEEVSSLLDEVYKVYGQFSAWKLRSMTHDESPWSETEIGRVISHQALTDFFKTQLV